MSKQSRKPAKPIASSKKSKTIVVALAEGQSAVKLQLGDVLLGRGSGVSRHPGNIRFRLLVKLYKEEYTNTPRQEKMNVAEKIVSELRTMNPSGRFLEKHEKTHKYISVHDRVAVEKTAQALRERKWSPFSRSEAYATLKALNLKLLKDSNDSNKAVKEPTVPTKASSKGTTTVAPKVLPVKKSATVAKNPLAKSKIKTNKVSVRSSAEPSEVSNPTSSSAVVTSLPQQELLQLTKEHLSSLQVTTTAAAAASSHETPKISNKLPVTPPRGKFRRLDRLVNEALQQDFELYLATLPPRLHEAYYRANLASSSTSTTASSTAEAVTNHDVDKESSFAIII